MELGQRAVSCLAAMLLRDIAREPEAVRRAFVALRPCSERYRRRNRRAYLAAGMSDKLIGHDERAAKFREIGAVFGAQDVPRRRIFLLPTRMRGRARPLEIDH